jgi:ketosteroid isomerase-like protein
MCAKYQRHLSHVEVVVFSDSGHMLWKPDYERFIKTIQAFLSKIDKASTRHRQEVMMKHLSGQEHKGSEGTDAARAICAADKALIAAETSRNLELAMAYMAPDVILQPPDRPMVVGREAVRQYYAEWFALPYTAIQVHAQTVTVASSEDLAYLVGESALVLSGPQGECQVPGKYLGVWRKIEGEWRLAALSWTGNIASSEG